MRLFEQIVRLRDEVAYNPYLTEVLTLAEYALRQDRWSECRDVILTAYKNSDDATKYDLATIKVDVVSFLGAK